MFGVKNVCLKPRLVTIPHGMTLIEFLGFHMKFEFKRQPSLFVIATVLFLAIAYYRLGMSQIELVVFSAIALLVFAYFYLR